MVSYVNGNEDAQELIYNYNGNQILFHSDRITLNSKRDVKWVEYKDYFSRSVVNICLLSASFIVKIRAKGKITLSWSSIVLLSDISIDNNLVIKKNEEVELFIEYGIDNSFIYWFLD